MTDRDTRRPETGPLKFGDDWTGLYIRGDNAFYYAMQLQAILALAEKGLERDVFAFNATRELLGELRACDERVKSAETQRLRPFSECLPKGIAKDEASR